MKKISNNITGKVTLLFLLLITQVNVWAQSAAGSDSGRSYSEILFSKPSFWIGIVLLISCIAGFFLIGRNEDKQQYE